MRFNQLKKDNENKLSYKLHKIGKQWATIFSLNGSKTDETGMDNHSNEKPIDVSKINIQELRTKLANQFKAVADFNRAYDDKQSKLISQNNYIMNTSNAVMHEYTALKATYLQLDNIASQMNDHNNQLVNQLNSVTTSVSTNYKNISDNVMNYQSVQTTLLKGYDEYQTAYKSLVNNTNRAKQALDDNDITKAYQNIIKTTSIINKLNELSKVITQYEDKIKATYQTVTSALNDMGQADMVTSLIDNSADQQKLLNSLSNYRNDVKTSMTNNEYLQSSAQQVITKSQMDKDRKYANQLASSAAKSATSDNHSQGSNKTTYVSQVASSVASSALDSLTDARKNSLTATSITNSIAMSYQLQQINWSMQQYENQLIKSALNSTLDSAINTMNVALSSYSNAKASHAAKDMEKYKTSATKEATRMANSTASTAIAKYSKSMKAEMESQSASYQIEASKAKNNASIRATNLASSMAQSALTSYSDSVKTSITHERKLIENASNKAQSFAIQHANQLASSTASSMMSDWTKKAQASLSAYQKSYEAKLHSDTSNRNKTNYSSYAQQLTQSMNNKLASLKASYAQAKEVMKASVVAKVTQIRSDEFKSYSDSVSSSVATLKDRLNRKASAASTSAVEYAKSLSTFITSSTVAKETAALRRSYAELQSATTDYWKRTIKNARSETASNMNADMANRLLHYTSDVNDSISNLKTSMANTITSVEDREKYSAEQMAQSMASSAVDSAITSYANEIYNNVNERNYETHEKIKSMENSLAQSAVNEMISYETSIDNSVASAHVLNSYYAKQYANSLANHTTKSVLGSYASSMTSSYATASKAQQTALTSTVNSIKSSVNDSIAELKKAHADKMQIASYHAKSSAAAMANRHTKKALISYQVQISDSVKARYAEWASMDSNNVMSAIDSTRVSLANSYNVKTKAMSNSYHTELHQRLAQQASMYDSKADHKASLNDVKVSSAAHRAAKHAYVSCSSSMANWYNDMLVSLKAKHNHELATQSNSYAMALKSANDDKAKAITEMSNSLKASTASTLNHQQAEFKKASKTAQVSATATVKSITNSLMASLSTSYAKVQTSVQHSASAAMSALRATNDKSAMHKTSENLASVTNSLQNSFANEKATMQSKTDVQLKTRLSNVTKSLAIAQSTAVSSANQRANQQMSTLKSSLTNSIISSVNNSVATLTSAWKAKANSQTNSFTDKYNELSQSAASAVDNAAMDERTKWRQKVGDLESAQVSIIMDMNQQTTALQSSADLAIASAIASVESSMALHNKTMSFMDSYYNIKSELANDANSQEQNLQSNSITDNKNQSESTNYQRMNGSERHYYEVMRYRQQQKQKKHDLMKK